MQHELRNIFTTGFISELSESMELYPGCVTIFPPNPHDHQPLLRIIYAVFIAENVTLNILALGSQQ